MAKMMKFKRYAIDIFLIDRFNYGPGMYRMRGYCGSLRVLNKTAERILKKLKKTARKYEVFSTE